MMKKDERVCACLCMCVRLRGIFYVSRAVLTFFLPYVCYLCHVALRCVYLYVSNACLFYLSLFVHARMRTYTCAGELIHVAGGEKGHEDGMGTSAQFMEPRAICITHQGELIVTDQHSVRKITFTCMRLLFVCVRACCFTFVCAYIVRVIFHLSRLSSLSAPFLSSFL